MKPITKIAVRQIKNDLRKNLFLSLCILFSMAMISFFVFFGIQTSELENAKYSPLPFTSFLNKVRLCMDVTVDVLVVITFITVRTHVSMKASQNEQTLAVLTAIGAKKRHKRALMLTEIMLIYFIPILLGVIIGIFPGLIIGSLFIGSYEINIPICIVNALGISVLGAGLIVICYMIPSIRIKRGSVIQSIKKQNKKASEERHGYRNSKTFKSSTLLSRLANKSIDYYNNTYNRIALSLASSALYPMLAFIMFLHIGNAEVALGRDMEESIAVINAVDNILIFICGCFLVLTVIGAVQAFFMVRMQMQIRKTTARIYSSIGMEEKDIDKMITLELKTVFLRALVAMIFGILIVNCAFALIVI